MDATPSFPGWMGNRSFEHQARLAQAFLDGVECPIHGKHSAKIWLTDDTGSFEIADACCRELEAVFIEKYTTA